MNTLPSKKNILKKNYEKMQKKKTREFRSFAETQKLEKDNSKLILKFLNEKEELIIDNLTLDNKLSDIIKELNKKLKKRVKQVRIKRMFNKEKKVTIKDNSKIVSLISQQTRLGNMELNILLNNTHKIDFIKGIKGKRKLRNNKKFYL